MKKDANVSLPLWLAGNLAIQRIGNSPPVTLDLPASLAPRVLNALKADPKTVDLRALAPHFYELAARTLDFFEDDEIVNVLSEVCWLYLNERGASTNPSGQQTFKKRSAEIADHAHNTQGALGDGVEFLRGLDEMERQCKSFLVLGAILFF